MTGSNKVYLDTNFLVDALVEGRPQSEQACEILVCIGDGDLIGLIMPSQLIDLYDICRRGGMDEATRRENITLLMDWCTVFYPNRETLDAALTSNEPDFEDEMIRAAAEQANADFILSRGAKAFADSTVPRIEPIDFVKRLNP